MTKVAAILLGFFLYFFVKYRAAIWSALKDVFGRASRAPEQKALRSTSVMFFQLEEVWPEDDERKAS